VKLSAAELHRRGRAHLNAGQNAAARRVLQLAAQRTDDADLRARIAGSLAAVTIRQGDPDAAEQLCREALARAGVSDATAAILYGQLGLLALEKGVLEEAIALLDRGIRGIGSEAEFRAPMLVNRSVAHCQAGRLRQARTRRSAAKSSGPWRCTTPATSRCSRATSSRRWRRWVGRAVRWRPRRR
jgi:tetratricopeptide (TPR) repeat protein